MLFLPYLHTTADVYVFIYYLRRILLVTPRRGAFACYLSSARHGPRENSPRASQRRVGELWATTWWHLAAMDGADGRTDGADGRRTVHVDSMVAAALAAPSGLLLAAVMVGAAPPCAAAALPDAGEA